MCAGFSSEWISANKHFASAKRSQRSRKVVIFSANNTIHIIATLRRDWNLSANLVDAVEIDVGVDNGGLVRRLREYFGPRIDDNRVTVGVIRCSGIARRRDERDVELIVERAGARQELPVERAGGGVEGARIDEKLSTVVGVELSERSEADVVADAETEAAKAERVEESKVGARRQCARLDKGDAALDIDVKEMHFAILGEQRSVDVEHAAGVVEAVAVALRNRSTDENNRVELSKRLKETSGASVGHGLGVLGEELVAVGRIEAFGKSDDIGTIENSLKRMQKVNST